MIVHKDDGGGRLSHCRHKRFPRVHQTERQASLRDGDILDDRILAVEQNDLEDFVTPGGLEAKARGGFPSADEEEVQAIARVIRYGASPGTVEALERMNMAIDVREVLPVVSAPRAPMARAPTATHVYGPRGYLTVDMKGLGILLKRARRHVNQDAVTS